MDSTQPLIEVRNLKKYFRIKQGFGETKQVHAVDDISFSIYPGESFGLVGESGCGKSTLGRLILALEKPSNGTVLLNGKNIHTLSRQELRAARKDMQVIFQDPYSSLNPRMTVEDILTEPMIIHGAYPDTEERAHRLKHLLDVVGLATSFLGRFPHEFSGGQRQRVGIARALVLNPKLIIADEPVSALDVSIQAQILNLLKDLQREFHLTYLFISHDFSAVRHLCNRLAVMYLGKIAEIGETQQLFENLQHPYTEALLSAVPVPDPKIERHRKKVLPQGDQPNAMEPPSGCRFHPRCRYAVASCKTKEPPLDEIRLGHQVACPVRPFKNKSSVAVLTR